jgi:hypothetical protein
MTTEPGASPVLGLLARALEFWLRQRCEQIEELQIRLEGSAAKLLRGRLDGVCLVAQGVVYDRLAIEQVELRSEGIQVQMGELLRHRRLELAHPFRVSGQVAFSGDGLRRSLLDPRWRELGDSLAAGVVGSAPLLTLALEDDQLLLAAEPAPPGDVVERRTRLAAVAGGLEVIPIDGGPAMLIPVDPDIRIDRVVVGAGRLRLEGEANVSP